VTINYGEFIAATIPLNKLERGELLLAAFQYLDKDGNGYITIDDLQQACEEHNMSGISLEDIEDTIRNVDQDNVSHLNLFSLSREPYVNKRFSA
jgi:calcium-dependent protein kinase